MGILDWLGLGQPQQQGGGVLGMTVPPGQMQQQFTPGLMAAFDFLRPEYTKEPGAGGVPAGTIGKVPQNQIDPLMAGTGAAVDVASMLTPAGVAKAAIIPAAGLAARRMEGAALPAAERAGIRAFHGSPHDFDRFDISKIGTGEGAQAYGHGLYFAENPGVAQEYKTRLAPILPHQELMRASDLPPHVKATAQSLLDEKGPQYAIERLRGMAGKYPDDAGGLKAAADRIEKSIVPGKMYEVNINAHPDQFLDWDKPVPIGSPIRERIAELGMRGSGALNAADRNMAKDSFLAARNENLTGSGAYHSLARSLEANRDDLKNKFGDAALFAKTTELARRDLLERGIPGIKYLDQGSRSAGEGSRNYVVFDDKLIDILRKYGLAGLVPGAGAMSMLPSSPRE